MRSAPPLFLAICSLQFSIMRIVAEDASARRSIRDFAHAPRPNIRRGGPVDMELTNVVGDPMSLTQRSGTVINITSLYDLEPPHHLEKRAEKITLDLISEETGAYIHLKVGTASEEFKVLVDSGSADFWLMSSTGPTSEDGIRYDPVSSGLKPLGPPVTNTYGSKLDSEFVTFEMYADTINVGGLTVADIPVGAASGWSDTFQDEHFSGEGIIGLAFPRLSEVIKDSLLNLLAARDIIPEPTVSIKMINPLWTPFRRDKSVLTLGGSDPSLFDGQFVDLNVVSDLYWIIQADSISINGKRMIGPVLVNVDTGTIPIIGDIEVVRALHKNIDGSEEEEDPLTPGHVDFLFPCDSEAVVTVTFAGQPFEISADELAVDQYGAYDDDDGPLMCKSGITGSEQHKDVWLLGQVFLRVAYTKLSHPKSPGTQAQVSFAKLKEPEWLPGMSPAELQMQT